MVMAPERTLGQKIKRARERKGWAQPQLAKELGVSAMTVSAWETDRSIPRVSLRPKLWAALGLTPDDFDPPPDGGRRRKSPTPNSRAGVAREERVQEYAAELLEQWRAERA